MILGRHLQFIEFDSVLCDGDQTGGWLMFMFHGTDIIEVMPKKTPATKNTSVSGMK